MNYSSYLEMQMDLARVNASMCAPHLEMVKQIERVLGPYRQQERLLDEMTKIAKIPNMAIASQSLASAFKAIQIDTSQFEKIVNIHKNLTDSLLPTQNMMEEIQKSAKLALGMSSYITAIAESVRAQIDYTKFHTTFGLEESVISNFANPINS